MITAGNQAAITYLFIKCLQNAEERVAEGCFYITLVRDIFLDSYNSGEAGNYLCAALHSPPPHLKLCNCTLIHT